MDNSEDLTSVRNEYLRSLEKKVEGFSTLFHVSAIITSTLDLDELMEHVMDRAKRELEAEACSILFYNRETNKLEFEIAISKDDDTADILKKKVTLEIGQGIAGWVAKNLKPLVIDDVSADERFYSGADKQTGFVTKNIIAVPLIGRRGLIGVVELINPRKGDYDLDVFNVLCNQFALAIENALLHKESVDKEKLRQQLEIASALQKSFLPEAPVFRKGGMTVSAVNIPAAKVGGDLYDFIEPAEGKAGILIGDVSGKGVSGAIYMAKIMSDFKYVSHALTSPEVVFDKLNAKLLRAPRGMFLTAIYMICDTATGEISVSSAGHPPFLLIRDKDVRVVDAGSGPPLGILPVEYTSTPLSLYPGDRLLLLTDGVYEARNKKGRIIGFENIVEFIRGRTAEENLVAVTADYVSNFSKGVERADDLTVLELKWEG